MQGVFLHGGDDGIARGMDGHADVAALPFEAAGGVGLGGDEPERNAVVVRRDDALALGVEGEAGDGGRVFEGFEHVAVAVEDDGALADGGGDRAAWVAGDALDPAGAVVGKGDRLGAGADEGAVVAAGQEALRGGVGGQGEDGAVVDVVIGPAVVGAGDVQAAFAGGEGHVNAGAVEGDGGDMAVDVAGLAAVLEEGQGQELCPWTPPRASP